MNWNGTKGKRSVFDNKRRWEILVLAPSRSNDNSRKLKLRDKSWNVMVIMQAREIRHS